jgi:hypothetical protein
MENLLTSRGAFWGYFCCVASAQPLSMLFPFKWCQRIPISFHVSISQRTLKGTTPGKEGSFAGVLFRGHVLRSTSKHLCTCTIGFLREGDSHLLVCLGISRVLGIQVKEWESVQHFTLKSQLFECNCANNGCGKSWKCYSSIALFLGYWFIFDWKGEYGCISSGLIHLWIICKSWLIFWMESFIFIF